MKILILLLPIIFFFTSVQPTCARVVINEILPHPLSGDDWLELFNTEASEVDVSGWIIEDSTSKIKTLSEGTKFTTASAYLQIFVSNRLNNAGDTIKLKDKEGITLDEKSYGADPGVDIALGRFPDGNNSWGTLTTFTPNSANSYYSPTATNEPEPTQKPTISSKSSNKDLVNVVINASPTSQNTVTKTLTKFVDIKNHLSTSASSPSGAIVGLVLGDVTNGSNSTMVQSASKTKIPMAIIVSLVIVGLGLTATGAIMSFKKLRRKVS